MPTPQMQHDKEHWSVARRRGSGTFILSSGLDFYIRDETHTWTTTKTSALVPAANNNKNNHENLEAKCTQNIQK